MQTNTRLTLAAGRVICGVVGLAAPRILHRLSLLDADGSPAAMAYTRFFGTRAIGLGVGYILGDATARRHLDRVGLLVDASDTVALASMLARGRISPGAGLYLMTATASAAAVGIASLRPRRSR